MGHFAGVDPDAAHLSKVSGTFDRELRHSVAWLNSLPAVKAVTVGKVQRGPVRGHYPGQLKVQSDTSTGLWLVGYLPDGRRHLYVSAAETDRDTVRDAIKAAFPPHKKMPAQFNTPRLVDTGAPQPSAPDAAPAPTTSEETDDMPVLHYISMDDAADLLGYRTRNSISKLARDGILRSRKERDPATARLVVRVAREDLDKVPPPSAGKRGAPRTKRRRRQPETHAVETGRVVAPPEPAPQSAPETEPQPPQAMNATALLLLMVRELRGLRADLADHFGRTTSELRGVHEKLDAVSRETEALREVLLQDRIALDELVK